MIIFLKKISDRERNCLIGQKQFIHTSQSRARIRRLPVHDHMTHVVKIDILSGHKEKGNLHFVLKIIFLLHIYRKTMQFLKTFTIYFESIAHCLTKFY